MSSNCTTMREHHLSVRRTARYFTLGPVDGKTRELWLACHGYGQLASRFLKHLAVLDDGTRLIVAPEALSRFYVGAEPARWVGASWMTREDRLGEIGDYVAYLDAVYADVRARLPAAPQRVVALGYSQGAATVARWAAGGTVPLHDLVLWGHALPTDIDLTAVAPVLRGLRLWIVAGTADPGMTDSQIATTQERLSAAGIPSRVRRFDGGHTLDGETLGRIAGEGRH